MGTRLNIYAKIVDGKLVADEGSLYSLGKLYGYKTRMCRKSLEYLYTHCGDFREDVDSFDIDLHDDPMEKMCSYFDCHGCTPVFRINAIFLMEFLKLYIQDQKAAFGDYNDNAQLLIDTIGAMIDDGEEAFDLAIPFDWG